MSNRYIQNSERLQAMHKDAKEKYAVYQDDPAMKEDWQIASQLFYDNFDNLAFPGGLGHSLQLLRNNNTEVVDAMIEFLYADPHFPRSSYIKEEILRIIREQALTETQKENFRDLIIYHIHHNNRREFSAFARAADCIAAPEFVAEVRKLTKVKVFATKERARKVISVLKAENLI